MSPLDRVDFGRRLRVLEEAVADLRRYAATVSKDRLQSEHDVQYMVLHALFLASQASVDLALQVCADRCWLPHRCTGHDPRFFVTSARTFSEMAAAGLKEWSGGGARRAGHPTVFTTA